MHNVKQLDQQLLLVYLIIQKNNQIENSTKCNQCDSDKISANQWDGEEWVTEEAETSVTNEIMRKFTGQEFDKESGLYYYNARYYDPKAGIFITPDPAMSGLNHYAYAEYNPIKFTDPTGMFEIDVRVAESIVKNLYPEFNNVQVIMAHDLKSPFGETLLGQANTITRTIKINSDIFGKNLDLKYYQDETLLDTMFHEFMHFKDGLIEGFLNFTIVNTKRHDIIYKMSEIYMKIYLKEFNEKRENALKKINELVPKQIKKDQNIINNDMNSNENSNGLGQINGIMGDFYMSDKSQEFCYNNTDTNSFSETGTGTGGGTSTGGGNSVICTELHRQGLMDNITYQADEEFGKYLREKKPYVMIGYHFLAKPVVKLMKISKTLTRVVCLIATTWAKEMAYEMGYIKKGDIKGKIIMLVGMIICGIVGYIIINPNIFIMLLMIFLLYLILKKEKYYIESKIL